MRERAFSLFDGRGQKHGHAMDDWLRAEREICWPAAELAESDGKYELDVALAGFEPNEIDVTATPSELIIKASHDSRQKKKEKRNGAKIRWSEFRREDVYRHVELPEVVDVDRISAHFDNGLLQITAPKVREKKEASKKIKISTAA
ncbi:MAG: Hsp20/alpha crystallin family protein [Gammaproteobacteria bacterium]